MTIAEYLPWVVVVMSVAVTLLIALIPAFIADKRAHPQIAAIRIVCAVAYAAWFMFGVNPVALLIWAVAWVWAFIRQEAENG